ncbi:MAG: Mur ligase domain-containing protein, partial [Bacteroidia bacterium]|nr:Mur ligase domain-containing protein [Bacteroidia bacterium]
MKSIVAALNAQVIQDAGTPFLWDVVVIDSRKLRSAAGSVFIAMKGARLDSHAYLESVYQAGVRNFIVENHAVSQININLFAGANILAVESGVKALQTLATLHRDKFTYPIVAITGSNGKTIVKEWLAHVLKSHLALVKNPKSYNSQVGVPLSVLHMHAQHNYGIFEAGISEPNEMLNLADILKPNLGILTLIGEAHSEGFSSNLHKLQEKSRLFVCCQKVLFGSDQALVAEYFSGLNQNLQASNLPQKYYCWSNHNPTADFYIEVEIAQKHTVLRYKDIS